MLLGRRVRQAGGLFIPHKYLLSKIIQNLNNSFGSSYTTICKQFCSGGWSSTNLGKRRLCKIYNSPFAITFTGKISLARDVGDKKASGLSSAVVEPNGNTFYCGGLTTPATQATKSKALFQPSRPRWLDCLAARAEQLGLLRKPRLKSEPESEVVTAMVEVESELPQE